MAVPTKSTTAQLISRGTSAPVASKSFKQVPPGSNNAFTPLVVRLLAGGPMCPQDDLLDIQYGSVDVTQCQAHCEIKACNFFWAGSIHGGKQCRLYKACQFLVQTENAQGSLMAVSRTEKFCHRADPKKCFGSYFRRRFLGAGTEPSSLAVVPGGRCPYEDLASQCDWQLILGGPVQVPCISFRVHVSAVVELVYGCRGSMVLVSNPGGPVQDCYRCDYALVDAGDMGWQQKRPLPKAFVSGQQLRIACWSAHYTPVTAASVPGTVPDSYTVSCAGGSWFGPSGRALEEFACSPCLQLAQPGYATHQSQHQQELYFSPSVKMQVIVDGGQQAALSLPSSHSSPVTVAAPKGCLYYYVDATSVVGCQLDRLTSVKRYTDQRNNDECGIWNIPALSFLCIGSEGSLDNSSVPICIYAPPIEVSEMLGPKHLFLDVVPVGQCPTPLNLEDYTLSDCSRPPAEDYTTPYVWRSLMEADVSLLQLRGRHRSWKRCTRRIWHKRTYVAMKSPKTSEDNAFQIRAAHESGGPSGCIEVAEIPLSNGSLGLKANSCQKPIPQKQALNEKALRESLMWSLQVQNKVDNDCSSAKEWPHCTMRSHCNESIKNGALTGMSLEGKQLPCSTTPISTSDVYNTGWIDFEGAKYEVKCPEGMLLSTLDHTYRAAAKQGQFSYSCVRATALGSCQNVAFSTEGLEVQCPEEAALQSFVLKKSPWAPRVDKQNTENQLQT